MLRGTRYGGSNVLFISIFIFLVALLNRALDIVLSTRCCQFILIQHYIAAPVFGGLPLAPQLFNIGSPSR